LSSIWPNFKVDRHAGVILRIVFILDEDKNRSRRDCGYVHKAVCFSCQALPAVAAEGTAPTSGRRTLPLREPAGAQGVDIRKGTPEQSAPRVRTHLPAAIVGIGRTAPAYGGPTRRRPVRHQKPAGRLRVAHLGRRGREGTNGADIHAACGYFALFWPSRTGVLY